jgi:hypothetical protein
MADPNATPQAVLEASRIEYRMPCDAATTMLPAGTVDYVFSANVLEHVPKPTIAAIFTEAHRLLRSGGLMYHHINPGDHFAQDTRITTANFLRYSSLTWYLLGGSGVAYHNRLRGADYIRMIEKANFKILEMYSNTDVRALNQLRSGSLAVHPDFENYTAEELACDIIGLFATPMT